MPESAIRFAVRSPGRRAATWKCWSPSGKDDVYLTCRELGDAFKASLHESGDWRIAYTWAFYQRAMHVEQRTERGRLMDQWARPAPIAPGSTLAVRIVTPLSSVSVTTPDEPPEASTTNLPAPAAGKAIEVDIFLLDPRVSKAGWPGMDSMQTRLVGSYDLTSGAWVCVVWWEIDMPALSPVQGQPKFYEGRSMEDLMTAEILRMLAFTQAGDGSRVIYDLVVTPAPSS